MEVRREEEVEVRIGPWVVRRVRLELACLGEENVRVLDRAAVRTRDRPRSEVARF